MKTVRLLGKGPECKARTISIWCCWRIGDGANVLAGKGLKLYILMLARTLSSTLAHVSEFDLVSSQRQDPMWKKVLPGTKFGEHRLGCGSRLWTIPQIPSMYSPCLVAWRCPIGVKGWRFLMWEVFFLHLVISTSKNEHGHLRLRSSFRSGHLGLAAACQAQASDTKRQPSSDLTIGRCRLDCNRSYIILLRPWGIPHQNFHGWNLKWWFPTAFSSFWAAMFLLEAQHFL